MSENTPHSLMNIGDLAKPIDSLINRVSDFVGGAFAPYQIKRIAKANAEAAIIDAQNETYISEIKVRAAHRIEAEQVRHQRSMEEIIQKSLPWLKDESQPEKIDQDWLDNFFDRAKLVSNEEMQTIWSKILAGEANQPGTYTKRTVNFLSELDKSEAEQFTNLCRFIWTIGDDRPLVFNVNDVIYSNHGVTQKYLYHLDSIGLIKYQNVGNIVSKIPENVEKFFVNYFEHQMILNVPSKSKKLPVGHVMLTGIGKELASISGCTPVVGFIDYVRERWSEWIPK